MPLTDAGKEFLEMEMSKKFMRRLVPLAASQFLGVFNDNAFKMFSILAVIGGAADFFRDSSFLFALTVAYVLPFLIFSGPAGRLADICSKRNILVLAKTAELVVMLLGTLCLYKAPCWGMWPLLVVMFLMTVQTAFFSPAFNGLLPESFPESELSRANGNISMLSFVASILGLGAASIIKSAVGGNMLVCGMILSGFSVAGMLMAMRVEDMPAAHKAKEEWAPLLKSIADGFKALSATRALLLSALGDAYFLGIGVAIQTALVMFAKYGLMGGGGNDMEIGILQLAPAIGIGLGCYLSGRLSGGRIELGLVPFGAAGVAIFMPLAVWLYGAPVMLSGNHLYPLCMLWLCLAGISGGIFIIPLRAYFQQRLDPERRGVALACNNAICFASVMISSIIVFGVSIGAAKGVEGASPALKSIAEWMPFASPASILATVGFMTLAVTVYAMWLLPDFALRFAVLTITHSLYKIKIAGAENIPERGPALLVSNHVSFVDGLLISACTSRLVRFLMHEDYYNMPVLNTVARISGLIEVPSPSKLRSVGSLFDNVKDALRQGELVCIFPEGKLTRNGLMDEFKSGYARMLPDDVDVPIIPVCLGMVWGSILSCYYGKLKFRFPKELPHPATVTIGRPLPSGASPFDLRQAVSELSAETESLPRTKERPVHYQLAKLARRHPFRKLFRDMDGTGVSAFELLVRAMLLSREIRRLAPDSSKFVGVMMPNCNAAVTAMFGVMMADKVPAPLNFSASKETLEASIRKASISCILTSRLFMAKAKLPELPGMVYLEDIAKGIPKWKRIAASVSAFMLPHQELMNLVAPRTHRDVFNTAVLLFSSGSTGSPKGVMLSHHNVNSDIYSFLRVVGWTKGDKLLGSLPLFHSFGLTTSFWLPVMTRCETVFVPNPLDSEAVLKAIEAHRLSILLATPTFMQSYMRRMKGRDLKCLRLVIVGAERLRPELAKRFEEMTDGLVLVEGYGCTELSPVVSINVANSMLDLGKRAGKAGSIGAPMPGICVRIVDPASMEPLPQGSEGLMLVKGPNVMQGYLGEPGRTEEVLKDEWYNTGDIAKMDADGSIFICGRLSRFSKIAGEMVPHEMVEDAINSIAGADDRVAAVCGVPDKDKGERLIVLHTELPLPVERIVEAMRAKGLSNLWIPKAASFRRIDCLPILASGKLDLARLRHTASEPAPEN